jgi:DNA-binding beta-propeller fold protein YncE
MPKNRVRFRKGRSMPLANSPLLARLCPGSERLVERRSRPRLLSTVALAGALAITLQIGEAISEKAESLPLRLEAKIPLDDVRGRIDHMAVDLNRHRLFVAALGNGTLAVVDLQALRLDRMIGGLAEPQGVGYDPTTDTVYVACAGDGSVRLFKGVDLSPTGRIELGSDADNIRVDSKAGQIFIGYGDGALAIVDAANPQKIASVPLKAHPESFQLDADTSRIFINVPNARAIEVIDRSSRKKIASWPTAGRSANFAMALDQTRRHVLVAFRHPAELGAFDLADGRLVGSIPTCGDVDDVFADAKRSRIYLSCGEGFIDVLVEDGSSYRRTSRIGSASGARTSLFVTELDRLVVAVPARGAASATIWVFRPLP